MIDAEGLWATITELAKLRGVDKSAISRRVARLEGLGLVKTRTGKGGTKLVNVAQFDRATAETTDAVRELNGKGTEPPPAAAAVPGPGDHVLAHEQARRAAYDADLKKLDLDERLARLLPTDAVEDAMAACAEAITRTIEQMPARAEENAAAVAKDGVAGSRAFLRGLARELRDQLARTLRLTASAAADGTADAT
jgi:DNA-binding MarR family transcriptional regulator